MMRVVGLCISLSGGGVGAVCVMLLYAFLAAVSARCCCTACSADVGARPGAAMIRAVCVSPFFDACRVLCVVLVPVSVLSVGARRVCGVAVVAVVCACSCRR